MSKKHEMHVSLSVRHSAFEGFKHSEVSMPRPRWRQHKNSFWHMKEIDRHTGCVIHKRFSKRGQVVAKKEMYDPEYEHWPMKVFDRHSGMVVWKRFDKERKLEVKEFYDPQYENWPIKVVDKHTGMVTWKRFDKAFNLEVQEFYAPELHDPEAEPRLGWAFSYRPQPPADHGCGDESARTKRGVEQKRLPEEANGYESSDSIEMGISQGVQDANEKCGLGLLKRYKSAQTHQRAPLMQLHSSNESMPDRWMILEDEYKRHWRMADLKSLYRKTSASGLEGRAFVQLEAAVQKANTRAGCQAFDEARNTLREAVNDVFASCGARAAP